MSRPPTRIALLVVATLATLWIGWSVAGSLYFDKKGPLEGRIASLRKFNDDAARESVRRVRLERDLQSMADRTLGADVESVDHELRSRLNRLGERIALEDLVVNTTRSRSVGTPARSQLRRREERRLRDEVDFVEVEGTLSGEGTWAQAVTLVHCLETEPWLKRIDQIRFDPKDNGERVNVDVRLTTLFIPRTPPSEAVTPSSWASEEDIDQPVDEPVDLGVNAALAMANPFLLSVPAPVEEEPEEEEPSPYAGWHLTGIVEGPGGVEIWLLHGESGESRTLAVGATLDELVIESVTADRVVVRLGEKRWKVLIGETLVRPDPGE